MKRADAVKIIHEIFETDTYGFRDSMTDEQIEAMHELRRLPEVR